MPTQSLHESKTNDFDFFRFAADLSGSILKKYVISRDAAQDFLKKKCWFNGRLPYLVARFSIDVIQTYNSMLYA